MIDDSTRRPEASGDPAEPQVITGEPRVDEALARLADLEEAPGAGHVEAFEHVHRRLHGMLGELAATHADTAPGPQLEQA